MRDAAWRRAQEDRIRRKVRRYRVVQMHLQIEPEREPEIVGKWAHTRPVCSCWMCGNPRKYFGEITIQEQRLRDRINDYREFL